jgi:thiol-disulfide isomerase/thioredoxin
MRPRRALTTLLLALPLAGCARDNGQPAASVSAATPKLSRAPQKTPVDPQALAREMRRELEAFRRLRFVGMDDGPVPGFQLRAANGTQIDSRTLVGREAFVVLFFATWCEFCERKLTSVQRAIEAVGSMPVIAVSVDGPETWPEVRSYLQAVGFDGPVVRAADHRRFSLSYNPFSTVPLLVIVGRNGGLVDYQLGYETEHEQRLAASLRLAKTIGPLATPSSRMGPASADEGEPPAARLRRYP